MGREEAKVAAGGGGGKGGKGPPGVSALGEPRAPTEQRAESPGPHSATEFSSLLEHLPPAGGALYTGVRLLTPGLPLWGGGFTQPQKAHCPVNTLPCVQGPNTGELGGWGGSLLSL